MSTQPKTPIKIAIIGAGITGLTIANRLLTNNELAENGQIDVTLFEKARGVSGRTSTRRAEPYNFDHGAPFFTAHSDEFKAFVQTLIEAGVVSDWQASVAEMTETAIIDRYDWQANKRFVGVPKMNAIAKHLAQDLNVQLATRVEHVTPFIPTVTHTDTDNISRFNNIDDIDTVGQWQLTGDKDQDLGVFDWVICTAPAQQAHDLVPTTLALHANIINHNMQGCYTLMLGFESPIALDFDVALIKESSLSCITVNAHKPKRPDSNTAYSLTILSSNEWAERHIETNQDWVKNELLTTASKITGHDLSQATHIDMHRWRYANTCTSTVVPTDEFIEPLLPKNGYLFDADNHFAVAGDWLIKGSVENAFLSGSRLTEKLADKLTSLI